MLIKILALFVLMIAAYCQDHHGTSFTLQSLVTHEVPQKVEHHFQTAPVLQQVHAAPSQIVAPQLSQGNENEIQHLPILRKPLFVPAEPAPVYETHEPVRVPVQLKIVQQSAPYSHTQHRVLQLVQQAPIKPIAISAPSVNPVLHQVSIAPIVHPVAIAPVVSYAPIQHPVAKVPQQAPAPQHVVEIVHQAPIQHQVIDVAPVTHHEATHHEDTHHKVTHHNEIHEDLHREEQHHEEVHQHKEQHIEEQHHGDHHYEQHVDYYDYPKYEFAYEVKDPHTHDEKYQHETRDGEVVKGEYGLHEPDGSIRTVKYSSDKKTGFHAEVLLKGHTEHIIPHHHH